MAQECPKMPETAISNNTAATFAEFLGTELNQECIIRFADNLFDANLPLPKTVPQIIEWIAQGGTSDNLLNSMEHLADCLANAAVALIDICDDYRDLVERQNNEVEDLVITLNMGDNEGQVMQ